ncbi:MAG: hypothetical protein ACI4L9_07185 [Candidatus Coproplasma sp.]
MNNVALFFTEAYSRLASIPYELLLLLSLSALGAVFIIALFACLVSFRVRTANKRPFFHLLNMFTAIVFAVFLMKFQLSESAMFSALYWCAGYLLYGILCAITKPEKKPVARVANVVSALPASTSPIGAGYPDMPAAKSSVRLEHALSIADKLLMKNLGKGDRQELEKMKTTLTVMQIKGSLSPQEGEILNDNFNALLKLMAKYNI